MVISIIKNKILINNKMLHNTNIHNDFLNNASLKHFCNYYLSNLIYIIFGVEIKYGKSF